MNIQLDAALDRKIVQFTTVLSRSDCVVSLLILPTVLRSKRQVTNAFGLCYHTNTVNVVGDRVTQQSYTSNNPRNDFRRSPLTRNSIAFNRPIIVNCPRERRMRIWDTRMLQLLAAGDTVVTTRLRLLRGHVKMILAIIQQRLYWTMLYCCCCAVDADTEVWMYEGYRSVLRSNDDGKFMDRIHFIQIYVNITSLLTNPNNSSVTFLRIWCPPLNLLFFLK